MKAIILAGGQGTRLRPLTLTTPKSMVPIVDQPLLSYTLALLKRYLFTDVVITLGYLADQIQTYFGNGHQLNMNISYVTEKQPLGTAGSVRNALTYPHNEAVLVISGDILTNINLARLLQFHQQKKALATLALKRVADPREYGVAVIDGEDQIRYFLEKPSHELTVPAMVNTGIYILEPEIMSDLAFDTPYDFSYDVFPNLIKQGLPLFGYYTECYWRDIGTIASYRQAIADVLAGKIDHIHQGQHLMVC